MIVDAEMIQMFQTMLDTLQDAPNRKYQYGQLAECPLTEFQYGDFENQQNVELLCGLDKYARADFSKIFTSLNMGDKLHFMQEFDQTEMSSVEQLEELIDEIISSKISRLEDEIRKQQQLDIIWWEVTSYVCKHNRKSNIPQRQKEIREFLEKIRMFPRFEFVDMDANNRTLKYFQKTDIIVVYEEADILNKEIAEYFVEEMPGVIILSNMNGDPLIETEEGLFLDDRITENIENTRYIYQSYLKKEHGWIFPEPVQTLEAAMFVHDLFRVAEFYGARSRRELAFFMQELDKYNQMTVESIQTQMKVHLKAAKLESHLTELLKDIKSENPEMRDKYWHSSDTIMPDQNEYPSYLKRTIEMK